jgi:hypothetical protein
MPVTLASDAGGIRDGWRTSHPYTEARSRLLLVEGQDEWHLLVRLLDHLEITNLDVRSYEGKDNLSDTLRTLTSGSASGFGNITHVGIWRDAEGSAQGARQSIEGALRESKLPVPAESGEFVPGNLAIGYLLLPPGSEKGCLEDVLLASLAKGAEALPCVEGFLRCLREKEEQELLTPHPNDGKIKLHAFLCSLEDPSTLIGQAANQGVWDFRSGVWQPLIQFLRDLSEHQ